MSIDKNIRKIAKKSKNHIKTAKPIAEAKFSKNQANAKQRKNPRKGVGRRETPSFIKDNQNYFFIMDIFKMSMMKKQKNKKKNFFFGEKILFREKSFTNKTEALHL